MEKSYNLNKSINKSTLSIDDVTKIKKLIISTDLSDSQLSMIFNVSRQHINRIRHGQRWSSLDDLMKDNIYVSFSNHNVTSVLKFLLSNIDDYYIEELTIRGKKKK